MIRNEQSVSHDDLATSQAPSEMRVLTPDELREVVGAPVIDNGGGGTGFMTDVTSKTGG